jgi:L-2-hydroxyglutarate oxidase LhgO
MTLPFLGVHTTLTVNGSTKIGPTASPIWSREQYQGYVNFSKPLEFFDILSLQANLYLKDSSSGFRNLVHSELGKMLHTRNYLIKQASHLIDGIQPSDFSGYSTPGIRAQLVDTKLHKLEMDFIIEGDHHSTHILNAVSPGWTCCIPLAEMICSRIP